MILWSVDTRDWAPSKDRMKFATIIRKRAAVGLTEEHPVILLHDGGGNRGGDSRCAARDHQRLSGSRIPICHIGSIDLAVELIAFVF